jgi:hypothetical protein
LRLSFYSNGGWEFDGSGRVTCCGSAYSILQFRLERGSDGIKHCRKMKRKRDTIQWEGSITQCGAVMTSARVEAASGRGRGVGDDISWADTKNLTGLNNK